MNTSRRRALQTLTLGSWVLGSCASTPKKSPLFDAHCHIIDHRFPVIENQGFTPEHFPLEQYLSQTQPLGVSSGAIVSGSFHGFDQTYLKATLKALGPQWVGVTQVPLNISDQEILELSKSGVRALRFNIFRGRVDDVKEIVSLAKRVHDIGTWHAEIYADAFALAPHVNALSECPQIVIDHLGMTQKGIPVVLDLVRAGAKVKATGFGRLDMDIPKTLQAIASVNESALIFGTDMPSTRAKRAFLPSDIDLIRSALGPQLSQKVLWSNARALYRLEETESIKS
jgi:predicted TIM-barrel fold metal-dependent hydrolase